jgi:hypothetical protein
MARQRRRASPSLTSHFSTERLEQDDQKDDDQDDNEGADSYVHAGTSLQRRFLVLRTIRLYRSDVTLKPLTRQVIPHVSACDEPSRMSSPVMSSARTARAPASFPVRLLLRPGIQQ